MTHHVTAVRRFPSSRRRAGSARGIRDYRGGGVVGGVRRVRQRLRRAAVELVDRGEHGAEVGVRVAQRVEVVVDEPLVPGSNRTFLHRLPSG